MTSERTPFVFGHGDAPIAEMIDDAARVDFLESLTFGQIVDLCIVAIDKHDHMLRRAIDAAILEAVAA
jgi:hypothetical protein